MNGAKTVNIKKLVYTSLSIALVALLTFEIQIKLPGGGYLNFGDIMIFTTAAIMGGRTALIAGGVGSALSDLLSGYNQYAPATLVIKGLEGFICAMILRKAAKNGLKLPVLLFGGLAGGCVMVAGYYFYEIFLLGFPAAIKDVPFNLLQAGISAGAYIPVVLALLKTRIQFNLEK